MHELRTLLTRSVAVVTATVALTALALFGAGCSKPSASQGGGVSTAPTVDPTTQPLPPNMPPAQQAQIRQQQAQAYAQAQKNNQPPPGQTK